MDTKALLLLTTLKDLSQAKTLSQKLLDKKLAACVSLLPGLSSHYVWQGQLEEEKECLLLIKSTNQHWEALEEFLQQEHPYKCPEILAFETEKVSSTYLDWLLGSLKTS
ncbi:MAG: divalent-cation tolerance protein CutA [Deltaproteobacteria bacterium]|nr:divalent-cation tolerance protein CutA [Deltaproteobacteria bacterium]